MFVVRNSQILLVVAVVLPLLLLLLLLTAGLWWFPSVLFVSSLPTLTPSALIPLGFPSCCSFSISKRCKDCRNSETCCLAFGCTRPETKSGIPLKIDGKPVNPRAFFGGVRIHSGVSMKPFQSCFVFFREGRNTLMNDLKIVHHLYKVGTPSYLTMEL